jgi:hypothetical protein
LHWKTDDTDVLYLVAIPEFALAVVAGAATQSLWRGAAAGLALSMAAVLALLVCASQASDAYDGFFSDRDDFFLLAFAQFLFLTIPLMVSGAIAAQASRKGRSSRYPAWNLTGMLAVVVFLATASWVFATGRTAESERDSSRYVLVIRAEDERGSPLDGHCFAVSAIDPSVDFPDVNACTGETGAPGETTISWEVNGEPKTWVQIRQYASFSNCRTMANPFENQVAVSAARVRTVTAVYACPTAPATAPEQATSRWRVDGNRADLSIYLKCYPAPATPWPIALCPLPIALCRA